MVLREYDTRYEPLPYKWDFRIKDTVVSVVSNLHKALCCIGGNHDIPYRDYDPNKVHAPVARHEKIRIFVLKATAKVSLSKVLIYVMLTYLITSPMV